MEQVDELLQFVDEPHADHELCAAWNFISHIIDDGEEADNENFLEENVEEVRQACYDRGVLDAILREMSRPSLRLTVLKRALVVLTMATLSSKYYKVVCEHPGIIPRLNEICKETTPEITGAYALTCLTNLAIHPAAHPYLKRTGSIDIAKDTLKLLTSKNNNELDCGLSAAFFMVRVSSRSDSNLALEHPVLIEKLAWILDAVIKAGRHGVVIGYNWNPANIMLDIYTLLQSNCDRALFARFVPLITEALRKREDNWRMIRLAVFSLLFLIVTKPGETLPAAVLEEFKANRKKLIDFLSLYDDTDRDDIETLKNMFVLKMLVQKATS